MYLTPKVIHDVVHPTAAFVPGSEYRGPSETPPDPVVPWAESQLNPVNRIDSLDPVLSPLWRIDGCTAFGSQFYAVPLFVDASQPLRFDVFIPDPSKAPADMRRILDMDAAFHMREARTVNTFGITQHVLRILQRWTRNVPSVEQRLLTLPFGSRIVLENLPWNVQHARIAVASTHYLERQLWSVSSLRASWPEVTLPPVVDIRNVAYLRQIHDSVCVVRIDGRLFILKALTSHTKYMYHELRQLLTLPPHQNIISKPLHLVTKRCAFGNKSGVVGFTTEYHELGSMRDLLPFYRLQGLSSVTLEIKWALQLTSALIHVRRTFQSFYSDLRLDNIVLSSSMDLVMVDFEQRGLWCEFGAPEVNAIEYIRIIAEDEDVPAEVRAEYAALLSQICPGWQEIDEKEEVYRWPSHGYNIPWDNLTDREQEACEVYMLGRVLWCIFEAQSSPQQSAVWFTYQYEPTLAFPQFERTPQPIRDLINDCTRGYKPGTSSIIMRKGNHLVLRDQSDSCSSSSWRTTAEEIQSAAHEWWTQELHLARKWLLERHEGMKRGEWNENFYSRPALHDVFMTLKRFAA